MPITRAIKVANLAFNIKSLINIIKGIYINSNKIWKLSWFNANYFIKEVKFNKHLKEYNINKLLKAF